MTPIHGRLGRLGAARRHFVEALEQIERAIGAELSLVQQHPQMRVSDAVLLLGGLDVEDAYNLLEQHRLDAENRHDSSAGIPAPALEWWQLTAQVGRERRN